MTTQLRLHVICLTKYPLRIEATSMSAKRMFLNDGDCYISESDKDRASVRDGNDVDLLMLPCFRYQIFMMDR